MSALAPIPPLLCPCQCPKVGPNRRGAAGHVFSVSSNGGWPLGQAAISANGSPEYLPDGFLGSIRHELPPIIY